MCLWSCMHSCVYSQWPIVRWWRCIAMVTVSGREKDGTAGSQQEIAQVRSNGTPPPSWKLQFHIQRTVAIIHHVFHFFTSLSLSLSLSVPKERMGSNQTSPQYTPFIPPGMFVTTLNSSAFVEGGGAAAVGSGRRGNPRMPDNYGNVELDVTEKDVSSGYGSQLGAHSEDTTVSLIVHTTKSPCFV